MGSVLGCVVNTAMKLFVILLQVCTMTMIQTMKISMAIPSSFILFCHFLDPAVFCSDWYFKMLLVSDEGLTWTFPIVHFFYTNRFFNHSHFMASSTDLVGCFASRISSRSEMSRANRLRHDFQTKDSINLFRI